MSSSTVCTSLAYRSQREQQRQNPATATRLLLQRWHQNWRTRRQLSALGAHELKDIGLNRGEALEEASKPFWRS